VVLWAYEGLVEKLRPALPRLQGAQVVVSPMAVLELQYLHEIGRVRVPAQEVVAELSRSVGLAIASSSWAQVVQVALPFDWTRDPFDRLIAAHAVADAASLLTADSRIRAHCANAVWD
jgi:PIN domain nuclease of toxin-antitoxin system